ncbi:hypothetical protein ILP92_14550 [Maribius pontilimi]|uniref:Uncharacterized protein n=1 Tax=Palleronia pontilimi TaxID=1964209 RepID=A0A934MI65_9RHOB|nr:hypothetical protein [Palleronia pontilimi]MBJ3763969.1 hypothetical protein [Palleronia pontilimi]
MTRKIRTALIAVSVFLTGIFAVSFKGAMAASLGGMAPSSLGLLLPFLAMAALILRLIAKEHGGKRTA